MMLPYTQRQTKNALMENIDNNKHVRSDSLQKIRSNSKLNDGNVGELTIIIISDGREFQREGTAQKKNV